MQLARLVLMGTITDVQVRDGSNERGPWRIVTAYLAGARQSYQVTLPKELEGLQVGQDVALLVYGRVYNQRVDYAATGLWDGDVSGLDDEGKASRAA